MMYYEAMSHNYNETVVNINDGVWNCHNNYNETVNGARDGVWSSWMTPEKESLQKYHRPTRFLYLVQTESCLPDKLLTSIGNASNGQCDILVLSYKQECPKILTASHNIEYILNSSTTWTTGRNLLYDIAMRRIRSERYLYYIFMDDDIELQYHDGHAKQSTGNPWREFEQFLKRLEPAVAALNIKGDSFVKGNAPYNIKQNICTLCGLTPYSMLFTTKQLSTSFHTTANLKMKVGASVKSMPLSGVNFYLGGKYSCIQMLLYLTNCIVDHTCSCKGIQKEPLPLS